MTHEVFILEADQEARQHASGSAAPKLTITQLNDLTLAVAFLDEDGQITDVTSAKCLFRASQQTPVLLLDAEMVEDGEGEDLRYLAEWPADDVDGEDLREFLVGVCPKSLTAIAWCEVVWVKDGLTRRCSFAIEIKAALYLPESIAPPPFTEPSEAWLDANACRYLPDLTALTGGDDTALDARVTTGKSNLLVQFYLDSALQTWRLFAGTDVEDTANGIVRPDDYDGSTNAQVWKRLL